LKGSPQREAFDHAAAMLGRVRIADPGSVMDRYPHQLSGGMQQRVAIAMALATNPRLLILDEPTTGLDATIEAEVLDLIAALRVESSTSVLFISHNLAVIAQMCDRVGVLYAGTLVEEGATRTVFNEPRHPYTVGLLRCLPQAGRRKDHGRLDTIPGLLPEPGAEEAGCVFAERCAIADDRCRAVAPPLYDIGGRSSRCYHHERAPDLPRATPSEPEAPSLVDRGAQPLLRVRELAKTFGRGGHLVRAVSEVALELWQGETLGLVGESGSGKTTFAHLLLGLLEPDQGSVLELGGQRLPRRLADRKPDQMKALQIIFQNPDSALNRSHTVQHLIGRAIAKLARVPRVRQMERLMAYMRAVRLADRFLTARPRQLSGGLKQRVAIARAFAIDADLILMDEPFVSLDQPTRERMQREVLHTWEHRRRTVVFVTHNLEEAVFLGDRVIVLSAKPARIIANVDVPLPRPRNPLSGEFTRIRRTCSEIMQSLDMTAGSAAGSPATDVACGPRSGRVNS
jgi:peptide/nickel transport system ATP-binding protein